MENVLSGKEPLKIFREKSFSKKVIKEMKSPNEEVQMLKNVSYGVDSFDSDSASDYINRNAESFNPNLQESMKAYSLARPKLKPQKKSTFKAGSRAVLEVDGKLSPSQEEQLKTIADLVQSILKEK